MKGPGHRHRYDVRRIWECPACRRQQKTSGTVVCQPCTCQADNIVVWMRLVEENHKEKVDPVVK
jgi:hypothetical protein